MGCDLVNKVLRNFDRCTVDGLHHCVEKMGFIITPCWVYRPSRQGPAARDGLANSTMAEHESMGDQHLQERKELESSLSTRRLYQ